MGKRGRVAAGAKRTLGKGTKTDWKYFPPDKDFKDLGEPGKEAAKLWKDIVMEFPEGHFRESDRPQMRAYVTTYAKMKKAAAQIALLGEVIEDHLGNPRENPWSKIHDKCVALVASLATKLRISKSANISPKESGRARHDADLPSVPDGFGDTLYGSSRAN
ncbi:P27 family phage terminase small subunit [Desulfococcaceae bacterium OttesenSCG-928-F15]|nr:P27 family phage terminase small subunit [Desulfococcaceae bacterium OttesenSCG-928-F15]